MIATPRPGFRADVRSVSASTHKPANITNSPMEILTIAWLRYLPIIGGTLADSRLHRQAETFLSQRPQPSPVAADVRRRKLPAHEFHKLLELNAETQRPQSHAKNPNGIPPHSPRSFRSSGNYLGSSFHKIRNPESGCAASFRALRLNA